MNVARLLGARRRSSGLKQERLAYRAGATQTYIGRVEHRRANPSLSSLERIIAAIGRELRLNAAADDLPSGEARRGEAPGTA
ncbi:MAG TPA: helix-turn-helix domain-containing protein [Solirubrobacteraceae bacterium]|nr:helix-turn-helix domain-containing protein [Solirubrobacteraceae bacterium]